MTTEKKQYNKGGRPLKADPCRHRYSIKLNDAENARFLAMVDETGWNDKAKFIKTILFKREIKYVKLDKAAMDYYVRLTTFHSQFRAIGVNYNQVVKHLKATFTEKTALALLYKLEKATRELVTLNREIVELTREFEEKFLKFAQ
ncbi:MAG: MobA protein [Candidatus Azobacteroides sp.]|nr:MobA protein [Candidatus Azobacteroides sp.]